VIVLDTNVVSELMRPAPSPAVVSWVSRRDASTLLLLRGGRSRVASRRGNDAGRQAPKRDRRGSRGDAAEDFAGRVLPFDSAAARAYAGVVAARRAAGRPVATMDMQIAAIAQSRNMAVATRNTRGFTDTGVDLPDPWTDD
jgi:hypothetical protein